ncbi:receptor-type tyrosine-protein phosphatase eta-like [Saccostrea echinata]|uniref:receptor-type tyrosine-protein phosphatase eta-like n=1 Tax=Saccostrea echinata TaxID=191078 RepID=UPI002A836690|nr:receptor-type tyrosine-protein phosphatase eta-like [Saccostrea echinata]
MYLACLHGDYSQWKKNISDNTQIVLSSLFPGLLYEMVVFVVSHSEMSPPSVVSDDIFLTATYKDTNNAQQTEKLTCRMLIHLSLVDVAWIPEPQTVLGLLDNSSSTSHLHLTILPPTYSYFNLYNIEVFKENGSELLFDQNISLSHDETDIFLWNLTAGTLYNFFVTTRTIWEENPYSPEHLQIKEVTNSSVTFTWMPVTSGGLDYYQCSISHRETNTQSPVEQDNLQIRQVTFDNLVPGKNYTVVRAAKQKKLSPQITYSRITHSGRELDVDWSPPSDGIVDYYNLYLTADHTHPINVTEKVYISYHRFTSLHPGETYTVHIRSHVANMMSSEVTQSAMTNPSSVAELYVDHVGTNTVNISWPRPNGSTFDTFQIAIDPPHAQSPISILDTPSLTYLTPGQLYKISITTVNKGIQSDQASVHVITEKDYLQYHDLLDSGNTSLPMALALHDKFKYETHILNLRPGHHYSVYVQAKQVIDAGNSSLVAYCSWQSVNKTTKPSKVVDLTYSSSHNDITLTWLPGNDSIQDSYFVWYRARLHGDYSQWKKNISDNTQIVLSSLFPGLLYEMVVFALSHCEMSPPSVVSALMFFDKMSMDVLKTQASHASFFSVMHCLENWKTLTSRKPFQHLFLIIVLKSIFRLINITDNLPFLPSSIEVTSVINNSLSLKWTYNSNTTYVESWNLTYVSLIDSVSNTVNIQANSSDNSLVATSSIVKKNRTDSDRSVVFSGLEGGTQYSIKVTAVSGDQSSPPTFIQIRTVPDLPYVGREKSANYIKLTIHKPNGNVDSYRVTCSKSCGSQTRPANQTTVVLEFGPLNPYTDYQFEIEAIAGDKHSSLFISSRTEESAPSAVQNLNVVEISPRTVNVSWSPPRNPNGIIRSYHIAYTAEDEFGHIMDQGEKDIGVTTELMAAQLIREKFTDLKAGLKYTFKVSARTVIENIPEKFEIVLRTYNPPIKDSLTLSQTKPKQLTSGGQTVTPSTITANFTNAFSDKYGSIQAYTVIIATDPDEEHIKTSTLPDWKAAQINPNIKAYQTIRNCSDFFQLTSSCGRARSRRSVGEKNFKVFEIGVEADCNNVLYCNGPLKQNTKYYIRLRAYTAGGYADTAYSDPITTGIVPVADDEANVGAIVAAVVCSVFVIVFIIAIFFFRSRLQKKSPEGPPGHSPRTSFSRHKKSHEFKVADFKEYIKTLSADSDFKYAEQFEDLKEVGRDQSCSAAELPVNRGKNRFTNILPYDHSRVKLLPTDDEEGSDYINANYMPGFTSKREYIVTQGPLPSTRDDFWRMIWEQNIRNIVMLTRCTEKGREKCDHYWPTNSDAMFYGDLQVAVLSETRFPSWTITEMRVAYGNVTRPIRHFHFTAWPDFGVPEKPPTLIKFVRIVRDQMIRECGPILVHCSAGVGRSGTFIVLDRLLQEIKERDMVDIFSIVHDLRKERVWMVQTEQQYVCIHQCLLCVLEGREEEHMYQNVGIANAAFDADDEGINVEIP